MNAATKRYLGGWKALLPGAGLALVVAAPVLSAPVGLQLQAAYDYRTVEHRNGETTTDGFLSLNGMLTFRRSLIPNSTLLADLSFIGASNQSLGDNPASKGYQLNLYADNPRYTLTGRIVHNSYGDSLSPFSATGGYNTYYTAAVLLRQTAWPTLSLQFQRNDASSEFNSITTKSHSTNFLTGIAYEKSPLRFNYDASNQSVHTAGGNTNEITTRTATAAFDSELMTGLRVTAEVSQAKTGVDYANGDTYNRLLRKYVRLATNPVRSTVLEFQLGSDLNHQDVNGREGDYDSWYRLINLRTEVLPGLSLDYYNQRQRQSMSGYSGTGDNQSRNTSLSATARLSERTQLNVTSTGYGFDYESGQDSTSQDSTQAYLQTALTPRTDLTLYWGWVTSRTGETDVFKSNSGGIGIRDRRSPRVTLGAAYRRNDISTDVTDAEPFSQTGDAFDVDVLWQPNYAVGLSLLLSYQENYGTTSYSTMNSVASLRWQLDTVTSLTANYNSQAYRQDRTGIVDSFGQDTSAARVRLTRNLNRSSFLELSYDVFRNSVSDTRMTQQYRVSYTTTR